MKKKILSVLLVASMAVFAAQYVPTELPTVSAASYTTEDGFTINNNTLESYSGSATEIVVPDDVTVIGSRAFSGKSSIKKITLPDSVVTIADRAFNECTALTEIVIPESVVSIGDYAFWNCSNLKTVTLPDSLVSSGQQIFGKCSHLTNVTFGASYRTTLTYEMFTDCERLMNVNVSENNPAYASVDGVLFNKQKNRLIFYPRGRTEYAYTLPATVKTVRAHAFENAASLAIVNLDAALETIETSAFQNCTELTDITIPDSVVTIGDYAFYNCNKAEDLTLGQSVEVIGNYAFSKCSLLTGLTFPDSVITIGEHAFDGCSNVARLTFGQSVETIGARAFQNMKSLKKLVLSPSLVTLGDGVFAGCSGLTSVTLPDTLVTIGSNAFANCEILPAVTIPESVVTIGDYAFYKNYKLKSIVLPDSVKTLGEQVFYDCSSLETATLPKHLKVIQSGTFRYCKTLTSVTLPEDLVEIRSYAFNDCELLNNVTLPAKLTGIGESAFNTCRSLESIVIPEGVTHIDYGAFSTCETLASVTFPQESLTSIGGYAFDYCKSLTTVAIPDSVTELGSGVLRNCTALREVTLPAFITYIPNDMFWNDEALVGFTIPDTVVTIGNNSFRACKLITEMTVPAAVESIGSGAFLDCVKMTKVSLPDSLVTINSYAFENCLLLDNVTIPESVTTLGSEAFRGCASLKAITVPPTITVLKYRMFQDCTHLKTVNLPDTMTQIEEYSFAGCIALKNLTIPESVKKIGNGLFYNCTALSEQEIPDSVVELGSETFRGCSAMLSAKLPAKLLYVPYGTFYDCAALTDVVLPDAPSYIDAAAFRFCRALPGITIPASVTSIRYEAFQGCDMMTGVQIPHGVESIGDNAFNGCLRLTGIVIPNTVTSTGWSMFYYCADTCDVFFEGTEEEWNAFASSKAPFNTPVTLHFTATMPTMSINDQPVNAKGEAGDKVSFAVAAEGVELSYRWQLSDDGGMTWRNSSGRAATYTTTLSEKNDGRYVRCVVMDKYGHKEITEPAYMRLAASVVAITEQPVDCAVKIGQPVSFTVKAEGKGLTYLWQLSDDKGEEWRDSSGKTDTYATTLTAKNNGRWVRCVVTDSYGDEVISEPAAMLELAACVTKQPVSVIVGSGEKAEFIVEARGEGLTYQWQLSDDMGETWRNSSTKTATYSATVTEANNGRYVRCVVTDNKGNTDTSDEASMTLSILKILANPANVTAEKGKIASFTVVAAGSGLKYQWQLSDDQGANWRNSKTTDMFYRALLTETNDGRWVRCVVTNKDGVSQTTTPASMKISGSETPVVDNGPTITKQPADQTGEIGELVKFSVTATGDSLTYQWQLSDDQGANWRNSSNKTAEYATTLSNANNGRYVRCVVTDANGKSVNSAAASMKVVSIQQSFAITKQPTDQTGEIGELVKFNVTATGEGLTYQWQLSDDQGANWRNSSNKTAEYATTLSNANNGRYVRCVVTDANGNSLNSNAASMKVTSSQQSLAITKQPTDQTGAIGDLVKFSVTATGEGLTYQWQLSDDQGANWRNSANKTSEYSTTLSDVNNGRYVRCIVTDANGNSVNSNAASMKVK